MKNSKSSLPSFLHPMIKNPKKDLPTYLSHLQTIISSHSPFLLYHNEEDETAIVLPGEFMTPQAYQLMKKEGAGDVALMCYYPDVVLFGIEYLSDTLLRGTSLPVVQKSHAGPTIDLKSSKTGSADSDKAQVIKRFAEIVASQDKDRFVQEFVIPGHVRTYLADPALLDQRIGHTELGVYLAKHAGLSGVVAMVTLRDPTTGTPLNLQQTLQYAKQHNYPLLYEQDILALYRYEKTRLFALSTTTLLKRYKKMLEIRTFEELLKHLFERKRIRGSYHLAIGQEATGVALGACVDLKSGDSVFVSHRGHHIALGLGLDYKKLFFECIGDVRGINNGRAGPMHFFYKSKGLLSANGIVAANAPIAAGVALAHKHNNTSNIVVNVIGEGSLDEGIVQETLTMAKLRKLPLLILCENNFYSQTTPLNGHLPYSDISKTIQETYGIKSKKITSGTDIVTLSTELASAVQYVRTYKQPMVVEVQTYRFCGHSMNDSLQQYKDPELDHQRKKKDPLVLLKKRIIATNKRYQQQLKTIETNVAHAFKKLSSSLGTTLKA